VLHQKLSLLDFQNIVIRLLPALTLALCVCWTWLVVFQVVVTVLAASLLRAGLRERSWQGWARAVLDQRVKIIFPELKI